MDYKRASGALVGLAIGDAIGAPLEGFFPPKKRVTDMLSGGIHNVRRGHFTDDTLQTLALGNSLVKCRRFAPADIISRFLKVYHAHPHFFGPTSSAVFDLIMQGVEPEIAARTVYFKKGGGRSNGSVMRGTPLGIFFRPEHVHDVSIACSRLTHYHPVACASSAFFNRMISELCRGSSRHTAYNRALQDCRDYEVAEVLAAPEDHPMNPSLDALDATHCAVSIFMEALSCEDAILRGINMGGDADTIGALCGALSGAYYGFDALPVRWRCQLAGIEEITELAYRLSQIAE